MQKSKHSSAFTLVELMIIVAIMADIMAVALPAFLRARNSSQNAKFITDLRTASAAFEMYAAENNRYPTDSAAGVIPTGMGPYLGNLAWSSVTPIGGRWDWQPNTWSSTAQLGVNFTGGPAVPDDVRMSDIDTRVDNGVLSTGGFRKRDPNNYMHIIE